MVNTTVVRSLSVALLTATLVVGCGWFTRDDPELTEEERISMLPQWVAEPRVENGLAATGCVASADSFSRDQSRADLSARQQLAAIMGIQIQSMAEQYERTTETADGLTIGAHFEEVTRGLIDEELRGSRRVRSDYVEMPNGRLEFCSMVAIGQEGVAELLERVAAAAGADAGVFTQAELREQFMSQEAFNRMDRQLSR
ncbi:hypothetical protein CKO15_01625 [Halorhodospira abdelmalekii]|uniref:hypothetical protein n=1 Tax=Halorhodospira abdelmalekii TaxID=421629 RepID=UPI001903314D|nr:hypothetical protein [Halorhodospira abdelmalekii]MBK1734000.1 hypothetical protein [Halorhodospira abdelmalekii]